MDIKHVQLQTNKLQEMKIFYGELLGFTILNASSNCFQIQVGISIIEFTNQGVEGKPFYHFALDIPANQFVEAKEWLKSKTVLLKEDGDDEVYFSFFVAKSCYFEDPSGNIIEFIARLNDTPESEIPFSITSIRKISELSLVVPDTLSAAEQLAQIQITVREHSVISKNSLNFMSDQKTKVYLLLVGPGRTWYFSDKQSEIFTLTITLDSGHVIGINQHKQFFVNKSIS